MPAAEQITDADATHGEGPVWSPRWGGLRWLDMLAGDVLHLDPETGSVHRWSVGTVAATIRPRRRGGAVIATEREFVVVDKVGDPVRRLVKVFDDSRIRFNDGGCDLSGNFWCGTMAYDETPGAGTLYRLRPDGTVDAVVERVTISNGLAWTGSADRAYYVDSATGRVDVFDSDATGTLHTRRPFVKIDPADGCPDGLAVDAEGGVWVALWQGRSVRRYSPDGVLDEVIEVPAAKVTACTFGGDSLDQLYITTSRYGEDPGSNPRAGAVFCASVGIAGLPVTEFAG